MSFQFTNPYFLLLLPVAAAWVVWLAWKSDVQISFWRRWVSFVFRLLIVSALVLAIAGLQWKVPLEGMNVTFLLDRSDSVPSSQQEAAVQLVNRFAAAKQQEDTISVLVFGTDSAIELKTNLAVQLEKVYAVVGTERTDIASAIRLGTAAFPETGQRRLVLISDGNENVGDSMNALLAAKPLGVRLDAIPLGVARKNDVSIQKLVLPSHLKRGQTFEVKIFAQSDEAQQAIVRLYRNEQLLGEQPVELAAGKNLFTFPQSLDEPGFYSYNVQIEVPGDTLPQNNRAVSFTAVRGDPRVLILSSEPDQDGNLAEVLRDSRLEVKLSQVQHFPDTLAEIQSYDAIFLCNVAAGDLGDDRMKLLESAVRDFGIGLVCIGGDQAFAAGGYRGTALERVLPVDMELSSRKVLPSGAIAMVMHGMEFMNGNEVARQCALGVLDALGPQDELGIVLWDGTDKWLFPMTKVSNKKELARQIAGMNQGDLPSFQNVMSMAHEGLKKSSANIKHMVIFSDGDPGAPTEELMKAIVGDRITVSTVLIAGHAGPETMIWVADRGNGRFYDVRSPEQLPQIFIKEAAVILKSAIVEESFKPQIAVGSEILRGIGGAELPTLHGYVATSPKQRSEVPLLSEKGDPLLAHWNYGLGRAVAFTSDAKSRWAVDWLSWEKYKQFWSQAAQWSLRKIDNADFVTEVSVDGGEGHIAVEAVDEQGNYRNFLNLQTVVVSPKGERQTIYLEQTGPGYYEARFPTKEVGAYLLNLMDLQEGQLRASQVLGASVNYSPEFADTEPNLNLLRRLAASSGGKLLDPDTENPFQLDRKKTFRPEDLWGRLLMFCILLFPLDVGIRRILIGREELQRSAAFLRRVFLFWRPASRTQQSEESLSALLARRDEVRSKQSVFQEEQRPAPIIVAEPVRDLFKPAKPDSKPEIKSPGTTETAQTLSDSESDSTTSRLLAAKRRAKK